MRSKLLAAALFLTLGTAGGCSLQEAVTEPVKAVTSLVVPARPDTPAPSPIRVLQSDTFLVRQDGQCRLSCPSPWRKELPESFVAYRARPEAWPEVVAIIPAGTHLRMLDRGGIDLSKWGTLLDGEHAGAVVQLDDVTGKLLIARS